MSGAEIKCIAVQLCVVNNTIRTRIRRESCRITFISLQVICFHVLKKQRFVDIGVDDAICILQLTFI